MHTRQDWQFAHSAPASRIYPDITCSENEYFCAEMDIQASGLWYGFGWSFLCNTIHLLAHQSPLSEFQQQMASFVKAGADNITDNRTVMDISNASSNWTNGTVDDPAKEFPPVYPSSQTSRQWYTVLCCVLPWLCYVGQYFTMVAYLNMDNRGMQYRNKEEKVEKKEEPKWKEFLKREWKETEEYRETIENEDGEWIDMYREGECDPEELRRYVEEARQPQSETRGNSNEISDQMNGNEEADAKPGELFSKFIN